jgi:hypothetical protein
METNPSTCTKAQLEQLYQFFLETVAKAELRLQEISIKSVK